MTVVLIDEPEGIYYGGTIAAPVVSELLDNALPYLGVKKHRKNKRRNKRHLVDFSVDCITIV